MKITNIFKKSTKIAAIANIEKLEKNQLEKVIGGAETSSTLNSVADALPTKHDTAKNSIGNIR